MKILGKWPVRFYGIPVIYRAALHGYILGLLPDRTRADDVLQETNLVLWRITEQR